MATRPDWHDYFLNLACVVSQRADCTRRRVGAVVVDQDHRIVATGYNGAEPGGPSCLLGQCPRANADNVVANRDYDNCVAVHAEANALLYAGVERATGCTLYITHEPCYSCWKLIKASRIKAVVWCETAAKPSGEEVRFVSSGIRSMEVSAARRPPA